MRSRRWLTGEDMQSGVVNRRRAGGAEWSLTPEGVSATFTSSRRFEPLLGGCRIKFLFSAILEVIKGPVSTRRKGREGGSSPTQASASPKRPAVLTFLTRRFVEFAPV